jgi:hypothetical protein
MKKGRIPSNQIRGYRKVFTAPITADNQSFQIDLPRGPALEGAFVVCQGSVTIGAGGTAVRVDAASKLVQRVDWVLNGNITLDSATGYGLHQIDTGINHGETPGLNPSGFAASTYPVQSVIPLFRVFSDMARPKDSVLKTDANITTNQLRVQMASIQNMFIGTLASAVYVAGFTINVYVVDYQETPDANGNTPVPLYYWKKTEQLLSLQSTGTGLPFRINTGNRLRAVILIPQDNINSEPTTFGTTVSRVRIVRSGDTRYDLDANGFSVISGYANASSQIGQTADTSNANIVIDFANSCSLFRTTKYAECWPVPSNSDVQLQLDVASIGSCRMLTIEGVDLQAS